jgi:2-methoxy-6-polyprenyl-1,4-benzoquinol methylase
MLEVGKERAKLLNLNERIKWKVANAECLSEEKDNTYDIYTIAFGIRNCTHISKVLSEAYRVLKPGGQFACLEFSRVNNTILKQYVLIIDIKIKLKYTLYKVNL